LIKPDIRKEEQSRLYTLQSLNVLDTVPEERFDRLTRMAKRLFSVPIALVSLVDENRQWFKSCIGLGVSETSRDISFCGHTILGDGVFVIPNAIEDHRFADNPLVLNDPKIRFYAGCPLTVNGYKLGTLCIIDTEPRSFDKEDIEILKDLASMAERELAAVQLATIDELTNISNRRGFMFLAQHSLNLCARQNIPTSLIFLNLDKFKFINDTMGHVEGDRALINFTSQMKNIFRESDIFARFGGDEFVALLTNISKRRAEKIVERMNQALNNYNKESSHGYDISFSHGIVEFNPVKHASLTELLADGDSLMNAVKNATV